MDRERQVAAYLRLAQAALRAGNPREAERWYVKILALDPANAVALAGLAKARRQRRVRRWLLPVGGALLGALLMVALGLAIRTLGKPAQAPATPETAAPAMSAPAPTPTGGASLLPPWPTAPEEALALAAHELTQGLLAEDFARLDVAARSLLRVQQTWNRQEAVEEEWMLAAARLTAALEACASRQWAAAAEHLAAIPSLPDEAQGSLEVGHFLVLLRAGEADLARYVNSLFTQPEYLRAAAGHYQMARALLDALPRSGDWRARLEHAPLRLFEDFGEPATLPQAWKGWGEGGGSLDPAGYLQWGGQKGALLTRAGERWQDYAFIARLRPEEEGKVGLAVRCPAEEHCCTVWLSTAKGEGMPWWLECREGEAKATHRPTPERAGPEWRLMPGAWHVVAVTVAGDQVALACDGVSLGLAGPLEGPPAGGVGLVGGGTEVSFDYVAVTDPPALPRE